MPTATASQFVWDAEAVRFRDSSGRFVAPTKVREAVDAFATGVADELESLTRRHLDGKVNLVQWELDARSLLKSAHLATAAVAAGGRDKLTPATLGRTGSRLRKEYEYLFNLSRARERGDVSDAQLVARIRMFGEGSTRAYEAARRGEMINAGFHEEARFLHSSNSCPECIDYASRGWVPVGTLPDTGTACSCVSRCRCTFSYRKREVPPVGPGPAVRSGPQGPPETPQPPSTRIRPPSPLRLPPKGSPLPAADPRFPGLTFSASDRERDSGDRVVWVDVRRLDAAWAADDPGFRVEPGGTGPSARPSSYAVFGDFLRRSQQIGRPIEMSRVYLDKSGKISFLDGRHRFAWMRDNGMGRVPIAVPKEAARRFARAFGVGGP